MFEKENNYNNDDVQIEKLIELSRFADAVMLDKRRQQFREWGVAEAVADADLGIGFDIDDESLNTYCVNNLVDPPNRVSILAFGDARGDTENSKRTLSMTLSSGVIDATYFLQCDLESDEPVIFTKTIERIYGVPDFDRYSGFIPGSAMFERVSNDRTLSDVELEILYGVLMYVSMNDLN